MPDIHCALCGEPWDADHIRHELLPTDRSRFLAGAGCEACDFGRSCPACSGTGREPGDRAPSCPACLGGRFLIIRQLANTNQPERWEYGCQPDVRPIDNPEIITR